MTWLGLISVINNPVLITDKAVNFLKVKLDQNVENFRKEYRTKYRQFYVKYEEERILANEFVYHNNTVIGCEESKLLFQNKGKIKAIERQNLEGIKIIIGDGYTDYEVFQNGTAHHFVYYCENINRSKISHLAEYKADSFEELIDIIKFL